ncbi:MAG: rhomboid family intramembrane serine protease [Bacteroidetes bacterium]|nr:rhomboid family intramembrane serine protease [Bacteroidota bacterium]
MYSSFWDNLKNAFNRRDNSLYKLMAINLIAFFVLLIARVVLTLSGFEELYKEGLKWIMMPASLSTFAMQPWSLFTYFFLHEGLFHILFNLLFLYYFGLLVHQYLGSRKLTNLYVLGGVFGAGFYVLMYNIAPYFSGAVDTSFMLGASAGIFAVVVGAATLAPQTTFVLFLLGPVKIVYIAAFYVILSFANSIGENAGGEIAHLGGAMLGFGYIFLLRKGWDLGIPIQKVGLFFENLGSRRAPKVSYRRAYSTKSTGSKPVNKETLTQEEVDKILDKIADKGYEGLTKEEKRKLFEYSKK